ncbi:MAG: alginate export family protein, partial [Planctomycetes bacterium]|nr:alginate export family protein [Planctomycetota bacterium]
FILDSDNDAWYNAGGAAMRRVGGGVSNTVGWELDIHAKHDLNDATKLWFGYSHFFPGNYVDQTGPDPATDWVYFQMTIAF